MAERRIQDLYERLFAAYGAQRWWPADGPFETAVGAILTQRTTWTSAQRAIERLGEEGLLSPAGIDRAATSAVEAAIRVAGFYRVKARKLKAFARFLIDEHGGCFERLLALDTAKLRAALLGVFGIGEETADAILVYAARRPSFVVDAYARRLLQRLGWIAGDERYGVLRGLFLDSLPADVALLGEYHALIVQHGKEHCRACPTCGGCPVRSECTAGRGDRREAAA